MFEKKMGTVSGQDHSWEIIKDLDPLETCSRANVTFDDVSQTFSIRSFGQDIEVSLKNKKVLAQSPIGKYLVERTEHFFDLALLWYLASAKDIPPAEELVSPADVSGGQIFVTGTHVLPLDLVANKYDKDPDSFFERGKLLGGEELDYGDAAIQLYPFPRLPVVMILWHGNWEFPPRVDLFYDSCCENQLPTDVLWSTAMVCVLAMTAEL